MADDRQRVRLRYLRALDQKSQDDPYGYWEPDELVDGYTEAQIQDSLRYWEQKGYADVQHSLGDQGLSQARITAAGQDFLATQARTLNSMFTLRPSGSIRRQVTDEPLTAPVNSNYARADQAAETLGRVVAVREASRTVADTKQSCFVIMPFQQPFDSYYTHIIQPAVTEAGLICIRADEITKPGAIIEQIWMGIQNAAVCVAELTGQRSNVMYELGLALFLQVKDFKPLSRPFLQLLSQPDSCHVAQTHEAHGVATAVCGSKRLVEVRRICCYAPFATPSGGNAGT